MKTLTTAHEIAAQMESMRNERQREVLMRFFKTGEGEYGYGDEFLGLKVPQTRAVVTAVSRHLPLGEVSELLLSRWHEVRLCGFLILVGQFEASAKRRLIDDVEATARRDEIVDFYLQHAPQASNWDLVDLSAPKILGHWLLLPTRRDGHSAHPLQNTEAKLRVMDGLAESGNLWLQRIGMVSTWKTTQQGDPSWCLRYAERHLHHEHDLMHKAVGWMLREMGKRVSTDLLRDFLRQHAREMPRTMLRYAIEKLPDDERQRWLRGQ